MCNIEKDGITQENYASFEPSKFKIKKATLCLQILALFWTNRAKTKWNWEQSNLKKREFGLWLKMKNVSSDPDAYWSPISISISIVSVTHLNPYVKITLTSEEWKWSQLTNTSLTLSSNLVPVTEKEFRRKGQMQKRVYVQLIFILGNSLKSS